MDVSRWTGFRFIRILFFTVFRLQRREEFLYTLDTAGVGRGGGFADCGIEYITILFLEVDMKTVNCE